MRLALIPVLPVPVPAGHRRVQPSAACRHAGTRPPGESHAAAFWQHFESLHIIQQPHYVSNYFPGQALFLAAGQVALHSPWAGVLAGCACFLLALYWALRGWMPARWALFGVLAGGAALWHCELLGERLPRRVRPGRGRRTGARRIRASPSPRFDNRWRGVGAGPCNSCHDPAVEGSATLRRFSRCWPGSTARALPAC